MKLCQAKGVALKVPLEKKSKIIIYVGDELVSYLILVVTLISNILYLYLYT